MVRYTFDAEHRPYFTPTQAVAIVREHGIMLEAARGAARSFASAGAKLRALDLAGIEPALVFRPAQDAG